MKKKYGKVFLAGTGPGSDALVSQAAIEAVRVSDVIIYDHLMSEQILCQRKPGAEVIYAGKHPGSHSMAQEKINALLVRKAKQGRVVARLKGGDPLLFGRGGEEALVLARAKIPFEIIPGVSSGLAAAAYSGVPLTHRGISSQVTFVTGHEDPSKKDAQVDWKQLAGYPGTLVIFMGMARIKEITRSLISAGMRKDTPVCVTQWGTLPFQRSVEGTVSDIADKAAKNAIKNPAVIMIGEVVALRKELNWYESKPLFGRKILVTRPKQFAFEFCRRIESSGAQAVAYPLVEVIPEKGADAAGLAKRIKESDWTVFTSQNAVSVCFDLLNRINADCRVFSRSKVAALGEQTFLLLKQKGITADLLPKDFYMESLLEKFKKTGVKGKRIFIPHSRQGRKLLVDGLKKYGASVEEMFIYDVGCPEQARRDVLKEMLSKGGMDAITFTSSSCVRNFFKLIGNQRNLLKKQVFAVIGPVTAGTLKEFGYKAKIIAGTFTAEGLACALEKYFSRGKNK